MPVEAADPDALALWEDENPKEAERLLGRFRDIFQRERDGSITLNERIQEVSSVLREESEVAPMEILIAFHREAQQELKRTAQEVS